MAILFITYFWKTWFVIILAIVLTYFYLSTSGLISWVFYNCSHMPNLLLISTLIFKTPLHLWYVYVKLAHTDRFLLNSRIYFSLAILELNCDKFCLNCQPGKPYIFLALYFIRNGMNKRICHVRIHSNLFLFWTNLHMCSVDYNKFSCTSV